jgi:hypothetical protein
VAAYYYVFFMVCTTLMHGQTALRAEAIIPAVEIRACGRSTTQPDPLTLVQDAAMWGNHASGACSSDERQTN